MFLNSLKKILVCSILLSVASLALDSVALADELTPTPTPTLTPRRAVEHIEHIERGEGFERVSGAPGAERAEGTEADQRSFLSRYTNRAQDVVLKALELVGIRYKRGGASLDGGLDCSGFVQVVFKESLGKLLPRTAREQSEVGDTVDQTELKPGDLVFFNTMRRAFSHVGIYLGGNQFLHSPRSGAEIRVEDMGISYWRTRYNGARRVAEQ